MLSRRELGGKIAVGAAVTLAAGVTRASVGSRASTMGSLPDQTGSQASPAAAQLPDNAGSIDVVDAGTPATLEAKPPWELLRPLTVGSHVANGWTLTAFTGAVDGSCVVTLENERGRQSRIHICSNDGTPQGLVYTQKFDLVVMNGGRGDLPTEESIARAVAELAHVLAANEGSSTVVASLMPHAERLRQCGESDRRLR